MKNIEVYVSAFFIIVGAVVCWQSLSMPIYGEYGPGPGLLPLWVAGAMTLLAVINLIQSLKRNNTQFSDLMPKGEGMINLLACVGSFALFMLIVEHVGFTISSIIMLSILFSRGYKWYWGLGMSFVVTGIVFYVFSSILSVPVPVNQYGW